MSNTLTKARQTGLEVLAINGRAHRSNQTSDLERLERDLGERIHEDAPLAGIPLVYWQTADWLVAKGFAQRAGWNGSTELITITDKGRDLLVEKGLVRA
jgi:hypothetical protein